MPRFYLTLLLCGCFAAVPLSARQIDGPTSGCASIDGEGIDLRCMDLEPTPGYFGASGFVLLGRAESPFGIAVAADGTSRYQLEATFNGLPSPGDAFYVAWLTTEFMAPVTRLGIVSNGPQDLGSVALNKFRILVSLETAPDVTERSGPLVIRGASPSSRLQGHDVAFASPLAAYQNRNPLSEQTDMRGHDHNAVWSPPPMRFDLAMPPGMAGIRPTTRPWLPEESAEMELARPQSWIRLADGDTLSLEARAIRRRLRNRDVVMFGFNGEFPGPLIEVGQAATVTIEFTNSTPLPTAVHWHGVRLDNRFDGVPGVTQDPVEPGGRFTYTIHFPDPGIYWYHPHHREDVMQDLGLYGNLLVRPRDHPNDGARAFDREEVLLLDDILVSGIEQHGSHLSHDSTAATGGIVPYGADVSNYALMGRFGNLLLVNGEDEYDLNVGRNEIVRTYLTNVSNTRTFNLRFGGAEAVVVGSDLGFFEWETPVESIVIAPAERYIVDIRYPQSGEFAVTNAVQALDHVGAIFFPVVDTLGFVHVSDGARTERSERPAAITTRTNFGKRIPNIVAQEEFGRIRTLANRAVDHQLELTLRVDGLPAVVEQLMRTDRVYFAPVEWDGTMPMMNWASTSHEVAWVLRDPATDAENMSIEWQFSVGDVVRVRVVNDRDAFHAMQHPLHIHGQRFAVVERDGKPNDNLVWKDTVLLPAGSTTDLLLELSNPGQWMVHCHIAEHLESGMKMVFRVVE